MSYSSIVQMGQSQSLMARVAACAAEQGNQTPQQWAADNLLSIAADASHGFSDAWTYARGVMTVNNNPDIGARDDVINDNMILSAVQARKALQGPGKNGWPA